MSAHTPRPESPGGLIETDQRSREIFPPDHRRLPHHRRAGRLAQYRPPAADDAVAGDGAQRHDRSRTGRLIYAPHTSAGRLPTERGLRFFVDAMMEVGNLTSDERTRIEAQMKAAASNRTLDGTLTEASALLSGLSRGAGVVVTTKANARLKHIEFVRLDPARALVVLVADDGTVENRLLALPPGLPASALTEAANFLNARIIGKTLSDLRREIADHRARWSRSSTR
jgi:heat-inducible transcriptional repressor